MTRAAAIVAGRRVAGRGENEQWQIGRPGNDDGVDWDRLNRGVDHCRHECPDLPSTSRLPRLPDLGAETRDWRDWVQRSPSDGWRSQIVSTSGFQWGYFVKLWAPLGDWTVEMRIDQSSRCRASIHAHPGIPWRSACRASASETIALRAFHTAQRGYLNYEIRVPACAFCCSAINDGHRQAGRHGRGRLAGRAVEWDPKDGCRHG